MTKHTPAPWRAFIDPKTGAFAIEDDNRIAVLCLRAPWPHRAEESAANARLIAAAPDLLAALKDCLAQAEGCAANHYPGEPEYCEGAHIQAARAAIAKTEGKP